MSKKFYYSYVTGYWLVDESKPWHYKRSVTVEDIFSSDTYSPHYISGMYIAKLINIGEFKSTQTHSSNKVKISFDDYQNKFVLNSSGPNRFILNLTTSNVSPCKLVYEFIKGE